jgi:hypothetical protein
MTSQQCTTATLSCQVLISCSCLLLLQYRIGDAVFLFNPRAVRQRVAAGKISGLPGKHMFHHAEIPETWFKVDIVDVLQGGVPLMYPNDADDQEKIEDVKGTCTIWDQKYIKAR